MLTMTDSISGEQLREESKIDRYTEEGIKMFVMLYHKLFSTLRQKNNNEKPNTISPILWQSYNLNGQLQPTFFSTNGCRHKSSIKVCSWAVLSDWKGHRSLLGCEFAYERLQTSYLCVFFKYFDDNFSKFFFLQKQANSRNVHISIIIYIQNDPFNCAL